MAGFEVSTEALLDEADGDVGLIGGGELVDEVGEEGIVLAAGDEARAVGHRSFSMTRSPGRPAA
jgi:hypothetical protein